MHFISTSVVHEKILPQLLNVKYLHGHGDKANSDTPGKTDMQRTVISRNSHSYLLYFYVKHRNLIG